MAEGMTNKELADKLRELRDFLIIAGYDELHAARYTQIARYVEKLPAPVEGRDARLEEIPGVGRQVQQYIKEILETGKSSKQLEWEKFAPASVLELLKVPSLGPKTAKRLYHEFGIADLESLRVALKQRRLHGEPGIGLTTIDNWEKYLQG